MQRTELVPPRLSVFAVEDRAVQLAWRTLPAGPVEIGVGDHRVTVCPPPPALLRRRGRAPRPLDPGAGGPGVIDVDGLAPSTSYDLTVAVPGRPRRRVGRVRTLTPPPGRLLARVVTVSDLHIGDRAFGGLQTIEDRSPLPDDLEPFALRCARAALREALAWGDDLVVVKGDLTRESAPAEFRIVAELLTGLKRPLLVTLGNHDVRHGVDGIGLLADHGVDARTEARSFDVPGLRVVIGHTPLPRSNRGRIDDAARAGLVAEVVAGGRPAMLAIHHPLDRWPVPTHYPPGIPVSQGQQLVGDLARANPATLITAGHTHRNRRRRYGPLTLSEVGSTKDYPGQWAGYAVHEGGVRQVVRRIADPSVVAWTEATRRALGGVWGWWSPGRLSDRCWTLTWPGPRR